MNATATAAGCGESLNMKDDIRKKTVIIIRRGPEFLVGRIMGTQDLRWTISPWEAWATRDRDDAETVARAVGGDLWLFNPIVGQIREVRR